ncbi:PREDICTED: uncharacterized protein LOC108358598 isoform X3 [Rhagoletis zephyria]|uniref:uncharacterized protein LOC108358598 isoform X3 n=1 Tax=Rhagoletis zephyria TaxID=28612 RepID=UPI0008116AC0|nr:PREDICTED: uncharacterized protein LOC108358598 isoform X3 [Rhagoletis zephyria]
MSKLLFKKYGARNTSTASIPVKKANYATDENNLEQCGSMRVSLSSEYTIESRRISVSTSAIGQKIESNQDVYEVVCCSHCEIFQKQLESLNAKVDKLQRVVETQNAAIMDAIAGQNVATEQLVRQESQKAPVVKYFPICNISEMQQLENKITIEMSMKLPFLLYFNLT